MADDDEHVHSYTTTSWEDNDTVYLQWTCACGDSYTTSSKK